MSIIVNKARKNKKFLHELYSKRDTSEWEDDPSKENRRKEKGGRKQENQKIYSRHDAQTFSSVSSGTNCEYFGL